MKSSFCIMALMAVKVLSLDAPIPGYTVEEMVWAVDIFNNGTIFNITGPVEDVYKVLQHTNSDLVKGLNITDSSYDDKYHNILLQDAGTNPVCGRGTFNWGYATMASIRTGIRYLRGVPGNPVNGPGPGACGRVSCSWSSAIWWCNDNNDTHVLESFSVIADCAEKICNECKNSKSPQDIHVIVGQNFMDGNWNCIVRRDNENC